MSYAVKEIFYTLQGEGAHTGRAAVFCRFAGCNLWSGREADRTSAICQFCDTDFIGTDGAGGGKFDSAQALAEAVAAAWQPSTGGKRFVVCTGGEPLLQIDAALIDALHAFDFEIAVETNGTIAAPAGLDWICVSPKAGAPLGHDHAAISLSDLHTPWEIIERRVTAAAEGDFVVAFYNPRSKGREWQLGKCLAILATRRPPGTPVGIVAEMIAATLNANVGGRDHGALYVERQVIAWCREIFGLPQGTSGVLTVGTSMASVIAIAAAPA